jgi:hypothetical protein
MLAGARAVSRAHAMALRVAEVGFVASRDASRALEEHEAAFLEKHAVWRSMEVRRNIARQRRAPARLRTCRPARTVHAGGAPRRARRGCRGGGPA